MKCASKRLQRRSSGNWNTRSDLWVEVIACWYVRVSRCLNKQKDLSQIIYQLFTEVPTCVDLRFDSSILIRRWCSTYFIIIDIDFETPLHVQFHFLPSCVSCCSNVLPRRPHDTQRHTEATKGSESQRMLMYSQDPQLPQQLPKCQSSQTEITILVSEVVKMLYQNNGIETN